MFKYISKYGRLRSEKIFVKLIGTLCRAHKYSMVRNIQAYQALPFSIQHINPNRSPHSVLRSSFCRGFFFTLDLRMIWRQYPAYSAFHRMFA